jgi:N-acetylneuraminic acid mutarotase
MKRFHISLLSILSLSVILYSCGKTTLPPTQDGNWVYRGDFLGTARSHAVSFVINENTAYVGTGIDYQSTKYNDFYQLILNGPNTSWEQVASCPGAARTDAIAFSVGNEGYVGMGQDQVNNLLSDLWQYDSASNAWTQKASMPQVNGISGRYGAVAFGIGSYGYMATGFNGFYLNDFWKYDPGADSWVQQPTYGGYKRQYAVAFTYNNKGYIVTGQGDGSSSTSVNDFWVFDPSLPVASSWVEKRHITNVDPDTFDDAYLTIVRSGAVGFVIKGVKTDAGGDMAYITTGSAGSITWEYHFALDLWQQKTSFERSSRSYAVGFSVQNRGFVALGISGSSNDEDLNEFHPDEVFNSLD